MTLVTVKTTLQPILQTDFGTISPLLPTVTPGLPSGWFVKKFQVGVNQCCQYYNTFYYHGDEQTAQALSARMPRCPRAVTME